MRSVLVDYYRERTAAKRGGGAVRVTLADDEGGESEERLDVLALDEALTRLAEQDPELAQLVVMRFFGGLSNPELSEALGVSLRTIERRWKLARAWLHTALER